MALDEQVLQSLCSTGVGPVAFVREGSGFAASLDGNSATVTLQGSSVRVTSRRAIDWPSGVAHSQIDAQVAAALQSLVLSRDDLSTLKADAGARVIEANVWIPSSSNEYELGVAIRNAIGLANLGKLAVDQVRPPAGATPPVAQAAPAPQVQQQVQSQPTPTPAPQQAPKPTPAATPSQPQQPAAFVQTHASPKAGLRTWAVPDAATAEGPTIAAGLPVQLLEQRPNSAWARVACSNGWTAWVDGRLLASR